MAIVYSDGDPPNGGVKCRWEAKIATILILATILIIFLRIN